MVWTVRLGGVLAVVLFAMTLLRAPARLLEHGYLIMYGAYTGVVLLRFRPGLAYRVRALAFCSLVFVVGVSAFYNLGALPGPVLVCAFVVLAARLFLGEGEMFAALAMGTLAQFFIGTGRTAAAVWPDAENLGAWFWVRESLGFAMATGCIAMLVAHIVEKLEHSLVATTEALRRLHVLEKERARTEAALARTEEALRRAQKLEAVGRLAAGVGHDFNNTLQVMLSWTAILKEEREENTLTEGLDAIERAALQGSELTQRLLEFGRRDVRASARCSPVELVQQSVQSLRRLLPEDIEIKLDLERGAPHIDVDPAQLAHVLLNLGVNARDAMPAGGVLRLVVESLPASEMPAELPPSELPQQLLEAAPRYVRISMRDSGVGMSAETLSHLFEPFYTTKGERGTGLGLATSYGMVQRNGGSIRAESTEGQGSTFHLYFPAREIASEPQRSAPLPRRSRHGVVMIAEDDASVRRSMARVLSEAGYHVLESADAASAMALLDERGQEVDLLCTDGIMPGGGTRQLIDRYLACRPGGQVIVCSGYVQEELLRRDLDSGAFAYLPKPFLSSELVERIEHLLGQR